MRGSQTPAEGACTAPRQTEVAGGDRLVGCNNDPGGICQQALARRTPQKAASDQVRCERTAARPDNETGVLLRPARRHQTRMPCAGPQLCSAIPPTRGRRATGAAELPRSTTLARAHSPQLNVSWFWIFAGGVCNMRVASRRCRSGPRPANPGSSTSPPPHTPAHCPRRHLPDLAVEPVPK